MLPASLIFHGANLSYDYLSVEKMSCNRTCCQMAFNFHRSFYPTVHELKDIHTRFIDKIPNIKINAPNSEHLSRIGLWAVL